VAEETVGCGVDLPHGRQEPARDEETGPIDELDIADAKDDDQPLPHHISGRGAMFRRRHRLHGDFALYGGRIDPGKGCEELIEYFSSYVHDGGDASLVLMGVKLMQLPEERWVRFAGLLSERERLEALEGATIVVVPSPYESLSLLALEAFAVGTTDSGQRALGGTRGPLRPEQTRACSTQDRDEFVEGLRLLLIDEQLRVAMGRNGRDYIRKYYRGMSSWPSTTGCWPK
jgi:glycosyltransferase involved in cell wall biosynthesis